MQYIINYAIHFNVRLMLKFLLFVLMEIVRPYRLVCCRTYKLTASYSGGLVKARKMNIKYNNIFSSVRFKAKFYYTLITQTKQTALDRLCSCHNVCKNFSQETLFVSARNRSLCWPYLGITIKYNVISYILLIDINLS